MDRVCKIEGCAGIVLARGWCSPHYQKWKREGSADGSFRSKNQGRTCEVQECERAATRRGMCGMHYLRVRKDGIPGGASSRYMDPTPDGLCRIDGCQKKTQARQLCPMHLERDNVHGDPGEAEARRGLKGAGYTRADGYRFVKAPTNPGARASDGYVAEHRLVMEQHIGRPLMGIENVHHKNGRRADNRLENLELWVKAQPAGQRVSDLVRFVVENYRDEVASALAERVDV
jgi:hypothetical protein